MNVRMLGCWFLLASACTPILTPVSARKATPLTGTANPPRVIWLLDNSGSLLLPANSTDPSCPAGCGSPVNQCPAACFTRSALLKAGVEALEVELSPSAQQHLTSFPTDPLCGPPSSIYENIAASLVISRVNGLVPQGGTPTGAALRYLADLPQDPQVETFVVLITDGLPNCNAENPNNLCTSLPDGGVSRQPTAEELQACRCTTTTCSNALCALGCMDELGTVAATQTLAEREMSLMVIGLGADLLGGAGKAYLGSMQIAVAPRCSSRADCGGQPCGADGECSEKFFLANATPDFLGPARRLARAARESERCTWRLPRQVTAADLTVTVGGDIVDPSQWTLRGSAQQRVAISGEACDRLIAGVETPTFSWLPPTG